MSDDAEAKPPHVFGFAGIWGLIANGTFATLVAILFTLQQQSTVGQLRELQQQSYESAREDRALMRSEMKAAHELSGRRWQQVERLTNVIEDLTRTARSAESELKKDKAP